MKILNLVLVLFGATAAAWHTPLLPGEPAGAQESATEATSTSLLSNIFLIGASVTNGFGNAALMQTSTNVPLGTVLRACLAERDAQAHIEGTGSSYFFMAPRITGASQAAEARAAGPSLVVALDFLFWYGCGVDRWRDPRRMAGLEVGLAELSQFTCPVVVGTIPDVRHALRGTGPFGAPIISPFQIPSEEDRAAMNRRILQWAAERENVELVDMASSLAAMVAGETIEIHGQSWKPSNIEDVLLPDLLHPNLEGTVLTALSVADAITRFDGASDEDFTFDSKAVKERLRQLTAASRKAYEERVADRSRRVNARGR